MSEFAEGYAVGQGNNNYGGGCFGGMGGDWLAILVLFALLGNGGWGGGGWGGGGNQLGYELGRVATTNDVAAGFNNSAVLNNLNDLKLGQSSLQNTLCQGFNGISREISDCCCNTQRAIDASTDRILGFLTNEKISGLQAENAALTAQLSQNAQTRTLIDALRPTAVPAYITCSPYQSVFGFGNYGGYGNGCGCGCGC